MSDAQDIDFKHFVARMTWDQVERRLSAGCDAILPIGAAAKEHGQHLPMDTDRIQAEWIAAKLAEISGALIWPTLTYGFYPAFRDFPGSITLSEATFESLVSEVIGEMTRWAPGQVFVLNTGISTLAAVERVVQKTWPVPVRHLKIHDGPRYRAAVARIGEQKFGSHADEFETSRMLIIAPNEVKNAHFHRHSAAPIHGPLTRDNTPSGSYGDPTLATKEKGKILLDEMISDLVSTLSTLRASFPP